MAGRKKKEEEKHTGWGGARANTGNKPKYPGGSAQVRSLISEELKAWVRDGAAKEKISESEFIARRLERARQEETSSQS